MTLEEVIEITGKSESVLKSQFKRTAEQLYRTQGMILTKTGRGKNVEYHIDYDNDRRANNLYNETRQEILLSQDSMSYPAFQFLVFLALATTPMLVFRGSYIDFLDYVQVYRSDENKRKLVSALEELKSRDIIMYNIDKTNTNYFVAAIYRKIEEETKIGIEMVKECKRLQEQYKKKEWIPLLKTWIGVQILYENQPYTQKELAEITGQSEYTVRESSKILEKSNIFKTSKSYIGYNACVGKNVELNAFYNK